MSLIIFDFDGTLFDSASRIHDGIANVFEACGLPVPTALEFFRDLRPPYLDFYRNRGVNISESEIDRLFVEKANVPGVPLFEDTVPTVKRLKAEGHTLIIVSGNYRRRVVETLREFSLEDCFSAVYGECQSKVEVLKKVVSDFKSTGEDSIMIGDSVLDVEHAVAAGIGALGIIRDPELREIEEFFRKSGARGVITSLEELHGHVATLVAIRSLTPDAL